MIAITASLEGMNDFVIVGRDLEQAQERVNEVEREVWREAKESMPSDVGEFEPVTLHEAGAKPTDPDDSYGGYAYEAFLVVAP